MAPKTLIATLNPQQLQVQIPTIHLHSFHLQTAGSKAPFVYAYQRSGFVLNPSLLHLHFLYLASATGNSPKSSELHIETPRLRRCTYPHSDNTLIHLYLQGTYLQVRMLSPHPPVVFLFLIPRPHIESTQRCTTQM